MQNIVITQDVVKNMIEDIKIFLFVILYMRFAFTPQGFKVNFYLMFHFFYFGGQDRTRTYLRGAVYDAF